MKTKILKSGAAAVFAVAAAAGAAPSWAGVSMAGTIQYEPAGADAVSAVPTVSEWGLIAMALLMAVMAYRAMRGRLGDRSLKSVLVAGMLGLAAFHMGDWVKSAVAAVGETPTIDLSNPAGGTADVPRVRGVNIEVTNTSGVPQKVVSLAITSSSYEFTNPSEAELLKCVAGLRLAAGAKCYVRLKASAAA